VAEGTGLLGSIVGTIGNSFGKFFDILKEIVSKIMDLLKDFAKWYIQTLTEKPEIGITLTALLIYMIT